MKRFNAFCAYLLAISLAMTSAAGNQPREMVSLPLATAMPNSSHALRPSIENGTEEQVAAGLEGPMKPAGQTDYPDEGFLNGTYEHLDEIYDGTLTHTIEDLRRERQGSRPIRVLFIGVGRGNEAIGAQRRFGEGVEVYAINKKEGEFYDAEAFGAQVPSIDRQLWQQEMHLFESVRSRLKIVDVEDEATSFEKLFGGDKFDLVVFGHKSAIYLWDKIKVFNRLLQQWVKPGGFLFVQTVFILHQEEETGEFFRQLTLKNPNVQRAGDSGLRLRNTGSLQIPLELAGEPRRIDRLPPYAFFSSYRTSQNDAELSAKLSAGLEGWPQRLDEALRQWQAKGWIQDRQELVNTLLWWREVLKQNLEQGTLPPNVIQTVRRRLETLEGLGWLFQGLSLPEGESPVKVLFHRHHRGGYKAILEVPAPDGNFKATLQITTRTGTPKVRITMERFEPEDKLRQLGLFRLGIDAKVPNIHLNIGDREGVRSWHSGNLDSVWASSIGRETSLAAFRKFQNALIQYLEQVPVSPTAGLEQTEETAKRVEELLRRGIKRRQKEPVQICYLCTLNAERSPALHLLTEDFLERQKIAWVSVDSAAVSPWIADQPSDVIAGNNQTVEVVVGGYSLGIPDSFIRRFMTRPGKAASLELLEQSDLILVTNRYHMNAIRSKLQQILSETDPGGTPARIDEIMSKVVFLPDLVPEDHPILGPKGDVGVPNDSGSASSYLRLLRELILPVFGRIQELDAERRSRSAPPTAGLEGNQLPLTVPSHWNKGQIRTWLDEQLQSIVDQIRPVSLSTIAFVLAEVLDNTNHHAHQYQEGFQTGLMIQWDPQQIRVIIEDTQQTPSALADRMDQTVGIMELVQNQALLEKHLAQLEPTGKTSGRAGLPTLKELVTQGVLEIPKDDWIFTPGQGNRNVLIFPRQSAAGLEVGSYPPPVLINERDNLETDRAYLNRHRLQWEWLRQNVVPELIERARQRGKLIIRVFIPGAGTSEQLPAAFHELAQILEKTPEGMATDLEDTSRWQIRVDGLERDKKALKRGRQRLEKEVQFAWNKVAGWFDSDSEAYAQAVIKTLNWYPQVAGKSLQLHEGTFGDPNVARRFADADLVILNFMLYQQSDRNQIRPMLDHLDSSWPNAFLALNEEETHYLLDHALHHDFIQQELVIKGPDTYKRTYYFGRPNSAAGLEAVEILHPERIQTLDLRGILFDNDETLWLGFPREVETRVAAELFGVDTSRTDQMQRFFAFLKNASGLPWDAVLERAREAGWPGPTVTEAEYYRIVNEALWQEIRSKSLTNPEKYLTPGTRELLRELKKTRPNLPKGLRLSIATGADAESRDQVLGELGIRGDFEKIYGGGRKAEDTLSQMQEWGFRPNQMGLVGDSSNDIRAAHRAGVLAIGFARTPADRQAFLDLPAEEQPDIIINGDFQAVQEILSAFKLAAAGLEQARYETILRMDLPPSEAVQHLSILLAIKNAVAEVSETHLIPQIATLFEESGDLRRTILEAASNLMRHGRGGSLEIYRSREGELIVRLADRGPGITDPQSLLDQSIAAHQKFANDPQQPISGLGFANIAAHTDSFFIDSNGKRWELRTQPERTGPGEADLARVLSFEEMGSSSVKSGTVLTLIFSDFGFPPGEDSSASAWKQPFQGNVSELTPPATTLKQAGLEGLGRMDAEEFFLRHREKAGWMPSNATDFYVASVDNPTVRLYRSEPLAAGLESHVAAQQHQLPGIILEQKPIPPSADRVRRPAVFILDDLIILTLPYEPEPAIRHRLGEPFPPLIQMVAKALFKELDAAGVKILAIQVFEENGRWTVAIATAA